MKKLVRSYVLDLVLQVAECINEGAGGVPGLVHVAEILVLTEAPETGEGGVGRVDPQDGRHELPIRGEEELDGVVLVVGVVGVVFVVALRLRLGGGQRSSRVVNPDPVLGQRPEIREELAQRPEELLIGLAADNNGEDMVIGGLHDLLALLQDAEAHHGLLLGAAHLSPIALKLNPDYLTWLELNGLEDVRQEVLDPLVRPGGLAMDLVEGYELVDFLVDFLASCLHLIVPDHSHLDLAEIAVALARSCSGVKGLQSLR